MAKWFDATKLQICVREGFVLFYLLLRLWLLQDAGRAEIKFYLLSARKDKRILKFLSRSMSQLAAT